MSSPAEPAVDGEASCRTLYLDLMKKVLTRAACVERYRRLYPWVKSEARTRRLNRVLQWFRLELVRPWLEEEAAEARREGADWPLDAETMIGLERLDNVEHCLAAVLADGVPGDVIECGVWRGGTVIFMRAVLKAHLDTERCVWVADSFQGCPKPDADAFPADADAPFWKRRELAVPATEVRRNFERYGLLDDRVRFLEGWFHDTLPLAPVERLALLRIDGDLYQSTIEALRYLYPKLSIGGFVIIDDYGGVPFCRSAVDDFRVEAGITDELQWADWTGVFWRRTA